MYLDYEETLAAAKEATIYDLFDVPEWLSYLPKADATQVIHAKWLPGEIDIVPFYCSNCHAAQPYSQIVGYYNSPYCPDCGARMDSP